MNISWIWFYTWFYTRNFNNQLIFNFNNDEINNCKSLFFNQEDKNFKNKYRNAESL